MTSRESDSSVEYHADVVESNKRSRGLDENGWDGRGYAPKAAAAADPKRFRRGDDYHDDGNDNDNYQYQRDQRKDKGISHYRQGDDYPGHEYDVGGDWNHSEQPSRDLEYNQEYPNEDGYGNQEDEVELDEFGRQRAPPNMTRKAAPDEWPPCFKTHSSSYVFDTRCAMFYQSDSGFFYDPQTKLYYGNKQGAYFRYDESKKPPFEQVQNAIPKPQESSNQLDPMPPSKSTDQNKMDTGKKMISIKIKSKTLVSAKPKKKEKVVAVKQAPAPPVTGSSRVQKEHGADMEKWSERQVEKKEEVKQKEKPKDKGKVVKTIKGEPICLLCKRKFPTIEKLHYHENASALHQENLAKQSSVIKTESSDPSRTDYVDRAQQRRDMHGVESSMTAPSLKVPAALPHTNPTGPPPTKHPSENLGQTNIGNQMLQKLGWKSGDSLGRQEGDANQNEVQNAIVKDWEKIEAIASNGGKGQHPGGNRRHR